LNVYGRPLFTNPVMYIHSVCGLDVTNINKVPEMCIENWWMGQLVRMLYFLLLLCNTCNNYSAKNEGSMVMNVPSFIHSEYSDIRIQSTVLCPHSFIHTLHSEFVRVIYTWGYVALHEASSYMRLDNIYIVYRLSFFLITWCCSTQ